MKWFKHDSNASRDTKLKKLQMRYGMEGYGLYWYLLERIANNVEIHNLTFELEDDAEIISHDTGLHQDQVQEMMRYMVTLKLFEVGNENVITCLKLAKRLDQSMTSNPQMREKIAHIKDIIPDRIMTLSCESHDSIMLDKKRIDKKRRDKGFTPPSLEDLQGYMSEMGYKLFKAEDFINFYTSKGWVVGKTKMKCWKSAAAQWESRNKKDSDDDLKGMI